MCPHKTRLSARASRQTVNTKMHVRENLLQKSLWTVISYFLSPPLGIASRANLTQDRSTDNLFLKLRYHPEEATIAAQLCTAAFQLFLSQKPTLKRAQGWATHSTCTGKRERSNSKQEVPCAKLGNAISSTLSKGRVA